METILLIFFLIIGGAAVMAGEKRFKIRRRNKYK